MSWILVNYWNAYGKVRQVTTSTATMTFGYDAQQNRLKKTVNGVTSYYIRDAQGNTLAVYERSGSSLKWKEQDLYGSSRLGMAKPEREVTGFFWASAAYPLVLGAKSYELSNHLGNVMAVISDRGELQSAQDYFPFGMAMPGRSSGSYRYTFNGKETDPETGLNDFGARLYDGRLGRWLAVDPLAQKYPTLSPYNFVANTPLRAIDPDGRSVFIKNDDKQAQKDIEDMAQSKGTHYKLTWTKQYDKNKKETGYSQLNLTIDCEATPNAVDVNVELLAAMCTAKEKYLYEVNAMVTGKIRDKEDLVSAPIGSDNKDKFRAATNLSVTDRADPPSSTSDPMMRARYKMFNAQPLNGFDGHIYLSPNTNSVRYFNTEVAGKPLPKPGSSVDPIDTQPLPRPVLAYHEMTECFFRTTGGMIMRDAHKRAEEWEARNKKAQALPGYLDNGKPLIIQHN